MGDELDQVGKVGLAGAVRADEHKVVQSRQVIAQLEYGDWLGAYDFTGDPYFCYIRAPRLLVLGERGEIVDREVAYLAD